MFVNLFEIFCLIFYEKIIILKFQKKQVLEIKTEILSFLNKITFLFHLFNKFPKDLEFLNKRLKNNFASFIEQKYSDKSNTNSSSDFLILVLQIFSMFFFLS